MIPDPPSFSSHDPMNKIDQLRFERASAHRRLLASKSKVYAAFLAMEASAYADGALHRKHKELIAVGISIVTHCDSCIEWHITQAAQAGATRDEVFEAVEIAIEMGGGPATVSSRFALDVMETVFGTGPAASPSALPT